MKKILSVLIVLSFLKTNAIAIEIPKDYQISFLLPVDWSKSYKHRDLSISIPKDYESLQPSSEWEKVPLIEFVPKGENGAQWTEIITVQTLVNSKVSAFAFADFLKQSMAKVLKVEVISEKTSKDQGEMVFSIFKYANGGRTEIMGFQYFSGPHDCSGVQYTIAVKKGQSEQEVIEKINQFFSQNVAISES